MNTIAMYYAVEGRNLEMIDLLIEHNAPIDNETVRMARNISDQMFQKLKNYRNSISKWW